MDQIFLRGMQFFGRHGVFSEETSLGQRFVVHLRLSADLSLAGETDDISRTIDYGAVYRCVQGIVEGEPVRLLERLATRVAADVLDHFDRVQTVEVTVEKPNAPIPGVFDTMGVTLVRHREDEGAGEEQD